MDKVIPKISNFDDFRGMVLKGEISHA